MKRCLSVMLLCVLLLPGAARGADVLSVIPEDALVAVIVRNTAQAEGRFIRLAGKLGGDLEEGSLMAALLMKYGATPDEVSDIAKRATIDLKGPLAMVVVTPAPNVPGAPVAVVVGVADYRKFLGEMVDVIDAIAPEVTPDGTDVLRSDDGTLFVGKIGAFAVVANAEYVVKTMKAAGAKTLAVANIPDLRKTLAERDFTVYVNTNDLVGAFGPQIAMFRKMMVEASKNAPQPGMPLDPKKRQMTMEAQIELMLKLAVETESLCMGLNVGPEGADTVTTLQAVAGSTLAGIVAQLKPSPERLVSLLDGPGVMALEMGVSPEMMLAARPLIDRYLLKSGTVADRKDLAEYHAKVAKEFTRVTGRMAMGWRDAPGEPGMFHFVFIEEKRPGAPKRDVRKQLEDVPGLKGTIDPIDVKIDVKEKIETHRGIEIDRMEITFSVKPEAAEEMENMGNVNMPQVIKLLFGETMVVYSAELVDKSIGTIGYAKSDTLKEVIDRVLTGQKGTALDSPAAKDALMRLPAARSGLITLSVAELYRVILPPILKMMMPEMAEEVAKFKFERPSAMGATYGPTPGGAVAHLNVPVGEMQNIRDLFMALTQAAQRGRERQFDDRPPDQQ